MEVLKKIYILLFLSCSFTTFISAKDDEMEYIDDEDDNNGDDYDDETDYENDNDEDYDEIDSENNVEYNNDYKYNHDDAPIDDYNDDYNDQTNVIDEDVASENLERAKDIIRKKEAKARKNFFESYNRLHRDVQILKARDPYSGKKDGLANLDAQYKKFRIINVGLYGYTNFTKFIRYVKGNTSEKINRLEKQTLPDSIASQTVSRDYLLSAGLCVNLNIGSGGLSVVGGYCVMEDTYRLSTINTYTGFNIDILFRFPAVEILDLVFNFIDPIGIMLFFTGLRQRTEWFIGGKICFYKQSDIGVLKPAYERHTIKDLKELKDNTSMTLVQKVAEVLVKHFTFGRRVYINQHIFYSLTSSLIFPIALIALSKDCKEVGKFFKEWKFVDSILNVSLGILI